MTREEKAMAIAGVIAEGAAAAAKAMSVAPGWAGGAMAYVIMKCAEQQAFRIAAWTASEDVIAVVGPNLNREQDPCA